MIRPHGCLHTWGGTGGGDRDYRGPVRFPRPGVRMNLLSSSTAVDRGCHGTGRRGADPDPPRQEYRIDQRGTGP